MVSYWRDGVSLTAETVVYFFPVWRGSRRPTWGITLIYCSFFSGGGGGDVSGWGKRRRNSVLLLPERWVASRGCVFFCRRSRRTGRTGRPSPYLLLGMFLLVFLFFARTPASLDTVVAFLGCGGRTICRDSCALPAQNIIVCRPAVFEQAFLSDGHGNWGWGGEVTAHGYACRLFFSSPPGNVLHMYWEVRT